jgi:hypothetical protein
VFVCGSGPTLPGSLLGHTGATGEGAERRLCLKLSPQCHHLAPRRPGIGLAPEQAWRRLRSTIPSTCPARTSEPGAGLASAQIHHAVYLSGQDIGAGTRMGSTMLVV